MKNFLILIPFLLIGCGKINTIPENRKLAQKWAEEHQIDFKVVVCEEQKSASYRAYCEVMAKDGKMFALSCDKGGCFLRER